MELSKTTTLTVNKWSDLPSSPSNSAIYKIVMPITKMQYYLVGTNAFPANEGPIAVYKTKTNTQTAYQIILAKLNASKKFSSTQKGVISRAIEYILNPKNQTIPNNNLNFLNTSDYQLIATSAIKKDLHTLITNAYQEMGAALKATSEAKMASRILVTYDGKTGQFEKMLVIRLHIIHQNSLPHQPFHNLQTMSRLPRHFSFIYK